MIRLSGIKKYFGFHEVLRDVTFSVNRGEVVTLTGYSGCGKSTILNIISSIIKQDSGLVELSEGRIGYVFQKELLFPWMSAEENIVYALKRYMPMSDALRRAEDLLDRLGILMFKEQKPSSLSGGMKKRVNIARAFAVKPELLLLDEPFAFLDRENIEIVKNMISEAAGSGTAVILVTHDPESAESGDRIIRIDGSPVVINEQRLSRV